MNKNEANALLDTFRNVKGNASMRARATLIAALTKPDHTADARTVAMLAECRKALADVTAQRDALAARGKR
jgi:hypothetical protein